MTIVMTREKAEAYAERIRMALAEAGFPDEEVGICRLHENLEHVTGWGPDMPAKSAADNATVYRAFFIARPPELANYMACCDCWLEDPTMRMSSPGVACLSGDCKYGNKP